MAYVWVPLQKSSNPILARNAISKWGLNFELTDDSANLHLQHSSGYSKSLQQ
ncbi:hypothetical protein DPMN_100616 [Dreissena polymorpha]|uniref:Uncharacterized protein n=1 Tax=Dreissena polymorpha TaxID=45954 RepID=A0A9D4LIH9_DREPO|nr:hypothetical protein DPMN_100616 [Dreissena polymorpha]